MMKSIWRTINLQSNICHSMPSSRSWDKAQRGGYFLCLICYLYKNISKLEIFSLCPTFISLLLKEIMPWNNPWYITKGRMLEFLNDSAGNVWFIMSRMAEVTCKSIGGILGMAYTQVALVLLLPRSFASFPLPFQQMLHFHHKLKRRGGWGFNTFKFRSEDLGSSLALTLFPTTRNFAPPCLSPHWPLLFKRRWIALSTEKLSVQ